MPTPPEEALEAFPVSVWLDARGRFNLVSLVLFMPALMYLKLRGLGQGTVQELAAFNRTALGAIAAAWLICLVWDQLALQASWPRQALPRLGRYLAHNLVGLLLALMFLADLAWWPLYLGALMLHVALRGLRQPVRRELRPVGPLVATAPMPAFKRSHVLLSALSWLALLGLGIGYQGSSFTADRGTGLARARLQRLQSLVERYRGEFGAYPESLAQLQRLAKLSEQSAWQGLKNPYDGRQGYGRAYLDAAAYQRDHRPSASKAWALESVLGIYLDLRSTEVSPMAGLALYQPMPPTGYTLSATDIKGELIRDGDGVLSLRP